MRTDDGRDLTPPHWIREDHPRHHNNDCPYGIALRATMDKGEAA